MAPASVPEVEGLRVDAVEHAHSLGEPFAASLDDEVIVVAHQAEGVAGPVVANDDAREKCEEEPAVMVVAEDGDTSGSA